MLLIDCGTDVLFEEALRWQRLLVEARTADLIDDVVLMLTHDRVYTAGRRADVEQHVCDPGDIRVVRIERGGDVTYHGPGQVVLYPITLLPHAKAVRPYVQALEAACIATAATFGITAQADRTRTGVWVGDDKLAAIGIKLDGRVTSHGLAFNVDPDLADFAGIVPCGLHDAGVCSLASLGVDAEVRDVGGRIAAHLAQTLTAPLQVVRPSDVGLTTGATLPT